MNEQLDIIRVWRCDNCDRYELDFNSKCLFCRGCGRLMYHTPYQELTIKEAEEKLKEEE